MRANNMMLQDVEAQSVPSPRPDDGESRYENQDKSSVRYGETPPQDILLEKILEVTRVTDTRSKCR
jgi:hypothetical protein